MKRTLTSLVALSCLVAACTTANINEPSVCDTQTVSVPVPTVPTLPAVPAGFDAGALSGMTYSTSVSTTFDFSGTLTKVDDIASSVQIAVTKMVVDNTTGDLDWVQAVNIGIQSGNLPTAALATYTPGEVGMMSELNINVVMDSSTLLTYLKAGTATLTITLSAQDNAATVSALHSLSGNVQTQVHMCMSVGGTVNKSL